MTTSGSGRNIQNCIFSTFWTEKALRKIETACPVDNVREPTDAGIALEKIGSAQIAVLRSTVNTLSIECRPGLENLSPILHFKVSDSSYIWVMMDPLAPLYSIKTTFNS